MKNFLCAFVGYDINRWNWSILSPLEQDCADVDNKDCCLFSAKIHYKGSAHVYDLKMAKMIFFKIAPKEKEVFFPHLFWPSCRENGWLSFTWCKRLAMLYRIERWLQRGTTHILKLGNNEIRYGWLDKRDRY